MAGARARLACAEGWAGGVDFFAEEGCCAGVLLYKAAGAVPWPHRGECLGFGPLQVAVVLAAGFHRHRGALHTVHRGAGRQMPEACCVTPSVTVFDTWDERVKNQHGEKVGGAIVTSSRVRLEPPTSLPGHPLSRRTRATAVWLRLWPIAFKDAEIARRLLPSAFSLFITAMASCSPGRGTSLPSIEA